MLGGWGCCPDKFWTKPRFVDSRGFRRLAIVQKKMEIILLPSIQSIQYTLKYGIDRIADKTLFKFLIRSDPDDPIIFLQIGIDGIDGTADRFFFCCDPPIPSIARLVLLWLQNYVKK